MSTLEKYPEECILIGCKKDRRKCQECKIENISFHCWDHQLPTIGAMFDMNTICELCTEKRRRKQKQEEEKEEEKITKDKDTDPDLMVQHTS
jgi:hypothetical protein